MLPDIIIGLQKEMKAFWLSTNGNVILNTELHDDFEANFPLCIIDIDSAPDSAYLPGGATRMEWNFSLSVYCFEPNAYNSDDGGYSANLLHIIDDLRALFKKEIWMTAEMQDLLTNYGFRVTYMGDLAAPSLTIADKVVKGIKLDFTSIAIDMDSFSSTDMEDDIQTVSGDVVFVMSGTDVISIPAAPIADMATNITSICFVANWEPVAGINEYLIDIATDSEMKNLIINNCDVGNNLSKYILGLNPLTNYYYRVRSYNTGYISANSNIIHAITTAVFSSIDDQDLNPYHSVIIGSQEWIVENLRTTKYADGSSIPNLATDAYADWYLPSKDELNAMYTELYLHSVGGFGTTYYMSSSEYDKDQEWVQTFLTGNQTCVNKSTIFSARACRSFTSTTNYNLRDIGPAGGLIFYKSGNSYLEAAPTDITDPLSFSWSNITGTLIGTTGTAIGTGLANTNAIIAQAGFTTGAALLCTQLSINEWELDTVGAYCWYNNDIANKTDYGALYNWYAVNNASKLANGQFKQGGIVSTGWRVPGQNDFNTLINFIGGINVAGGKLKEIGYTHWNTPNAGASDQYGFKAVGAGYRLDTGAFIAMNIDNITWSATAYNIISSYYMTMNYDEIFAGIAGEYNNFGCSVRCMRDV